MEFVGIVGTLLSRIRRAVTLDGNAINSNLILCYEKYSKRIKIRILILIFDIFLFLT